MKTRLIIASVVTIILLAIILPKAIIQDNKTLTVEEIACAKRDTALFLDNPFERLLVVKTTVDKKTHTYQNKPVTYDVFVTNSYLIGGIKYATVELICNEGANAMWRRWF